MYGQNVPSCDPLSIRNETTVVTYLHSSFAVHIVLPVLTMGVQKDH